MEFNYRDLLPLEGPDTTEYRLVTTEGVNTVDLGGRQFLEVSNEALTALTSEAMRDIAHLLRPSHFARPTSPVVFRLSFFDRPSLPACHLVYPARVPLRPSNFARPTSPGPFRPSSVREVPSATS